MIYKKTPLAKQYGVALMQVLLISTVISVLALRFSYTAREQVETAGAFEQRIKAAQQLKSAQSKIIYTLLTESDFQQASEAIPDSAPWNFYGKAFALDSQTEVSIQDINGLLSQQKPNDPLWAKLLQKLQYSDYEIHQLQTEMTAWQTEIKDDFGKSGRGKTLSNGIPYRHQFIQLPQEITWFFEQYPERLAVIKQVSSRHFSTTFNPLNAPDILLGTLVDPALAVHIIEQRRQNELSSRDMINLLGNDYDNEEMTFFNGSTYRITINVQQGDVTLEETIEIKIQANRQPEVLILARY